MTYNAEAGSIRLAITGDSMITRPVSVHQEGPFLDLVKLLRDADLTFTNAEMQFNHYEDPPFHQPGGTYMRGDPSLIDELRWMGIDMVSCANNHTHDFGENGVLTNLRYLDTAGMPHAGTGRTLAESRQPVYVETAQGRVALIATTITAFPWMRGADQWRDGKGRPGTNVIDYATEYTVDREAFDALRRISEQVGLKRQRSLGQDLREDSDTFFYMPNFRSHFQITEPGGTAFHLGERFEARRVPNERDIEENLQRVRDARRMADWVIVSVHSHEDGASHEEPSEVMVRFAHEAIDAGADVIAGHGPHRDRGIELYKDRPIFYSLGHLFVQNEAVLQMARENMLRAGLDWEATPADFYDARTGREELDEWKGMASEEVRWRDAVAIVGFQAKKLNAIELHPIDLGFKKPRSQRGRPVLANQALGREVLETFQRLSEPYGTHVRIEDGVGVIRAES